MYLTKRMEVLTRNSILRIKGCQTSKHIWSIHTILVFTAGSLRSTNEAPSENVEFYQQDGSIETPLKGPNRSNQSFSLKIVLVLISQTGSHKEEEDDGDDDDSDKIYEKTDLRNRGSRPAMENAHKVISRFFWCFIAPNSGGH